MWGHSQGAWVVQLLAARASELAFAIANSGPEHLTAGPGLYGAEHTLRAAGAPAEARRRAVAYVDAVHAAAARGDDYATV